METKDEEILSLISSNGGIQAKVIAKKLGVDKKTINSALYSRLRTKVKQDKKYGWWVKEAKGVEEKNSVKIHDTPVTRLSKYYLDCLNFDDVGGVSVWAKNKYDSVGIKDYVEIQELPQSELGGADPFQSDKAKKLLSAVKRDKNRQGLYLGYPTRVRATKTSFILEPIFLFPFEGTDESYGYPTIGDSSPQINFKALERMQREVDSSLMDEVIQLSEELGLDGALDELPDVDELVLRLKSLKTDWDWKDEIDPINLRSDIPLSEINEQGIYNKAIIACVELSPFTRGLEKELTKLQSVSEEEFKDTALGAWVSTKPKIKKQEKTLNNLLEVLPLNLEQRHAVQKSLTNDLTVITGPPGTGKSQVVASILINCAFHGKSVLFVSKNNKAVDVVSTRVNSLGNRPILLRLGANEYQNQVSDYLTNMLAANVSEEDQQKFTQCESIHAKLVQEKENLQEKLNDVIKCRNRVDQLEQSVEDFRRSLGHEKFIALRNLDISDAKQKSQILLDAIDYADVNKQGLFTKLFWVFKSKKRFEHLSACIPKYLFPKVGMEFKPHEINDDNLSGIKTLYGELVNKLEWVDRSRSYFGELARLRAKESLENYSKKLTELADRISDNSFEFWNSWLKLQPTKLTEDNRQLIGKYVSFLQMLITANKEKTQASKEVLRNYYQLFPKIAEIFSCWAVTSLSANNRVPFQQNFFDLLVVDEASQCDIASILPLLFRAKRVVVIGDPMQLKHISTLSKGKDEQLLVKHELLDDFPSWSYSHRSLFDLATSLCTSGDVVTLRDHHRSHEHIMGFSNDAFYEGKLRIATNYAKLKRPRPDEPAVRWIDVKGSTVRPRNGGAYNLKEAQQVVDELVRFANEGYTGSIGVVSPFRLQANRISQLALEHPQLGATKLAKMEFLADTVHKFQGDERDVMIFSPTVSDGVQSTALGFLNSKDSANLFNVAITRARSALVVVGDRNVAGSEAVPLLAKFSSYTDHIESSENLEKTFKYEELGAEYPKVADPTKVSDWEIYFYKVLFSQGIKAMPQYPVEKYILDFALIIGEHKLNIEIDGELYHKNWDGELCRRDQIRNHRMIELGWDVKRFWVYQVRDEIQYCIKEIMDWISEKQSVATDTKNSEIKQISPPANNDINTSSPLDYTGGNII